MDWRLIQSGAADGAANMALDRALLDRMEERLGRGEPVAPMLRLYQWSSPTVSTGRHQALDAACDLDACGALGIDVVQRPTGGRGVLHDDELTYAVIAPASGPFAGAGVTRGAAAIAQAIAAGLARLGAPVEVVGGSPATASPRSHRLACFATASRAEVVASGRKLCGSAQLRGRAAFLQHGSLPLTFDPARQAIALGSDPALLAGRAVGLAEVMGRRPSPEEAARAIASGFAAVLGARLAASDPDGEESGLAVHLAAALRADERRWRGAGTPAGGAP